MPSALCRGRPPEAPMSPRLALLLLTAAALSGGCASRVRAPASLPDGSRADVAILETTDIHSNVLSYDYYKLRPDSSLGFERTATLIHRARTELPNSFLFDSGDTIQGSVLADYQARVKPLGCGQELAIYRAMDALGYDGGTAGNHEFNYGLRFLSQVSGTPMNVDGGHTDRCSGPHFPLVLANVDSVRDGKPLFAPWTIVQKTIAVTAPDGRTIDVPLRVGIIGFTPPPIMQWDEQNLTGKVTVTGVVEAAQKYLPSLQAQHPDVIVAILHGGLDTAPYTPAMENGGWYLAGVPGIDVLLLGHAHAVFPGPHYAGMQDVDAQRGSVRGVPAVMGGFFGKHLGVIQLRLNRQRGRWIVDRSRSHSEVRPICAAGVAPSSGAKNPPVCVPADPEIAPLLEQTQAAAVADVNTPIGESSVRMSSYFADEGDMTALAVINAAQADYVRAVLPRTHPELREVPILSSAAAFRTGFGGPDDYTDVAAGPLTLRSAADLYFFPNTLAAVTTDGAGLRSWLETSAQRFNRIDPEKPGDQALINAAYPGFNFDQIQGGVRYVIDVSRPVGERITTLTYHGKPVTPEQPFVIVTNNYRANGGGNFAGLDGSRTVLAAPQGTREILAQWLKTRRQIDCRELEPRSWRFAPLKTRGTIVFDSASGKQDLARAAGLQSIRQLKEHADGTATYAIDLSR